MGRSLASRLDRLERLAEEVLNQQLGPVYLREGSEVPAGVDPDRVIYIGRVLIDPPEQPQEQLPEIVEASPAIERASPSFSRTLATPPLGITSSHVARFQRYEQPRRLPLIDTWS